MALLIRTDPPAANVALVTAAAQDAIKLGDIGLAQTFVATALQLNLHKQLLCDLLIRELETGAALQYLLDSPILC